MKVSLRSLCVSFFRVWLTPLRNPRLLRGVPFSLSLLLLTAISIPGCLKKHDLVLDGGHLIYNDYESYWLPDSFPIKVLVSAEMPEEYQDAAFDAVNAWNVTTGVTLFAPVIMDFNIMLPKGCSWIAVAVQEDLPTTGLWRGIYLGETSALCHGQVSIQPGIKKSSALKVFVHEFGHALGLAHDTGDNRSIMYPTVFTNSIQFIMPDDVLSIRSMVDGDFRPLPRDLNAEIRSLIRQL